MKLSTYDLSLSPTTVSDGHGKHHPGIKRGLNDIFYWPNLKYDDQQEAQIWAARSILDVVEAANGVAEGWNLDELT